MVGTDPMVSAPSSIVASVARFGAVAIALGATFGCTQDKAAHASPAPQMTQHGSSEGFCSESVAPSASPSASSCTCEAPTAPSASAGADAATQPASPPKLASGILPELSTQALLVTTPTWSDFRGKVQRYERQVAGSWRAVGNPMPVAIGRRGLAWGRGLHPEGQRGPVKREGDNKSPAGVFDLAGAFGYATTPPPATTWPYHRLTVGWKCIDEPRQEGYNTLIVPEAPYADAPTVPWDGVRRDVVFDMFVVVKHNTDPVLPAAGSCVLIHPWTNAATPTQGCTSMSKNSLQQVLAWLSPSQRPVLIQLPQEAFAAVASAWGIPGR